jgi:hypothetical protein
MSYLHPDDVINSCPSMCHVCGHVLRSGDSAIVHDGRVHTSADNGTEYGSIGLHTECATILAMRLIADVMRHRDAEHEPRVVLSLSRIRKAILED